MLWLYIKVLLDKKKKEEKIFYYRIKGAGHEFNTNSEFSMRFFSTLFLKNAATLQQHGH